jgi:uncharacterized protein (TIGR02217 family)
MAFHDVQFPPLIAVGATGGPVESTQVVTTAGGHERRNINWSQARLRFNVGTGLKNGDDVADLIAFFRARRGRAYAFRFKDWSDYLLPRQSIGTTDGTTSAFQIAKRYSSGASAYDRTITLPVSGTVRVWVDNVERTLGGGAAGFTIDLTTGVVTLGATLVALLGKAVEVECEFDVRARFDTDEMGVTLHDIDVADWADIPVIEDRA